MATLQWWAKQKKWWARMRANYDTGDWAIFTMALWRFCSRFLLDFPRALLQSQISARDVLWVSLWRPPFMRRRTVLRWSWREFTQTCVDHSWLLQQKNTCIMWYLLMIILVDVGSSSCRRREKNSQSSVSLKHWWRSSRGRKWNLYGAIMVVNTSQENSKTSVANKELEENS